MNKSRKYLILFFLITISVFGFAGCRSSASGETESPEKQIETKATTAVPFDWNEISKRYDAVKSYTAIYEKEEQAISKGEKQTIKLSFRKPFDIRLDWLGNNGKIDQTAIYQQGKNDGKVRVRQGGLLGSMTGILNLDPNEKLALEDSKHPITQAGLGNLIEHIIKETKNAETAVNYLGEESLGDKNTAYKIEMNDSGGLNLTGTDGARKAFVWIDKDLMLPVKVEVYNQSGALLERHFYKDLSLKTDISDKTFEL